MLHLQNGFINIGLSAEKVAWDKGR